MARTSRKRLDAAPVIRQGIKVYDAGAYVRLSALDRKQKGDSIETQQAIINAYIDQRPDLSLREIYIDNGNSGMTFERPAFQRMLDDAEHGKINCIVTKDLSRLGRNAIDAGFYIEQYFPMNNIHYIAINDDYDSADGQCGGMMVSLKNIINEAYALDIGRKIRATKQMNIREGAFVGRLPPYGYLKSKEDNHRLVMDAEAAFIVRQMFEMAADGILASSITKHLNDNGVLPPKRYFHLKGLVSEKEADGSVHWSKGTVYSILHNRVYCGDMVQGKHRNIEHMQTLLPSSEWITVKNTHEPLVSREMWERVQQQWQAAPRKERAPYSENIFKGKIFCAHCGYAMRRVRHSPKSYGFTCDTRLLYDKADCVQVSINENVLKEVLLTSLRKQIEVFADTRIETGKPDNTELQEIRQALDKCGGYLKGLYESLALGDITAAEYKDMKQSYEARLTALSDNERRLRETVTAQAVREEKRRKASGSIAAIHDISDLTADMVNAFVERIDVSHDKSLDVKFRFRDGTGGRRDG